MWVSDHITCSVTTRYQQTSETSQAPHDIDTAIKNSTLASLLATLTEQDEVLEGHIKDLLATSDIITSHRYLSHAASAGRHGDNSLENK